MNKVFLNLKQPHLHTSLRWRILPASGLNEKAFLAEIDKKAVLSDLHAILYQKLCQVSNQDGRTGGRKQHNRRRQRMTPITRIEIWMCGYVLGIVTMLIREMGI